jgi:hypothetical protein
MKIIVFVFVLLPVTLFSQRVGIGTSTPSELLDVNGNVRIGGALKPRGDAGSPGQVLRSNGASAAPSWTQVGFTNMRSFAPAPLDSVTEFTFTVPDGVFTMMTEIWGAGGPSVAVGIDSFDLTFASPLRIKNHGGFMGGGGGGYAKKIFPVTPGAQIQILVSRSNITLNGFCRIVLPGDTLAVGNGSPGAFLFNNLFPHGFGGQLKAATGIMANPLFIKGETGRALEAEIMSENATSKKLMFTPGQGGMAAFTTRAELTMGQAFELSNSGILTPMFNTINEPFFSPSAGSYNFGAGGQLSIAPFNGHNLERGGGGLVVLYW